MRTVRYLLGVLFVVAGANHFISPDTYLEMMPSWLPLHGPAVFWSGVAEVAGGLMLFFDRTAKAGGIFLILVLIAVFPANVQMAIAPDEVEWVAGQGIPDWALWVRLALQPLLMYVIWWACGRPSPGGRSTEAGSPG